MNWDAIGAIGEIVGAAAVFVSLVYLAVQIRNQNRESRVSAMHEISVREALLPMASEDMATIFVKANRDYDSLTDVEAMRFIIVSGQFYRAWEEAFVQHQEGRLDDRSWNAMLKYYLNILAAPAARRAWELRQDFLDDEFVSFVNSRPLNTYGFR
jgi:hypothetical protein